MYNKAAKGTTNLDISMTNCVTIFFWYKYLIRNMIMISHKRGAAPFSYTTLWNG